MLPTYESVDICIFTIIKSIKHKEANNEVLDYLYYTKIINILKISRVARILSHEHRHIFW